MSTAEGWWGCGWNPCRLVGQLQAAHPPVRRLRDLSRFAEKTRIRSAAASGDSRWHHQRTGGWETEATGAAGTLRWTVRMRRATPTAQVSQISSTPCTASGCSTREPTKCRLLRRGGGEDDCTCTAYSYGKGGCSIWHGQLYDVRQQPDDASSAAANGDALYIRLAASELPASVEEKKKKNKGGVGVSAAAGGASAAAALVLVILGLVMIWRKKKGECFTRTLDSSAPDGIGIISFRYAGLQRATKNFSERLAGGSFGSVFKGSLNDSVTLAVKRLDGARQGERSNSEQK
jgi:hypothetical protein